MASINQVNPLKEALDQLKTLKRSQTLLAGLLNLQLSWRS